MFGTDGVRGVANADLTPELALRIGRALATVLAQTEPAERAVVVGRDTRCSGPMLEAAIVAGVMSAGRDAVSVGIVPTPAVAAIVRATGAAAGVVISASHNPIEDNGIKVFGSDGYKLSDEEEQRLEAVLFRDDLPRAQGVDVGTIRPQPELADVYERQVVDAGSDLHGLTVVVDAAFGAAYRVGPHVLRALGAEVIALHAEPDGARINVACGATDLRALQREVVRASQADPGAHVVGVAFDGDADRALFVDESGRTVSGDHVMLALARERKERGALPGDAVVATVMSNVGLEIALAASGIGLIRTAVGDRYVLEAMRAGAFVIGGEQSGHVVDLERSTTGDGVLTAVRLLSLVAERKTTLEAITGDLRVFPQVLLNVPSTQRDLAERSASVRDAIAKAERELAGEGRVLVRPSGTEPLIRVMVEGKERSSTERLAGEIAAAIQAESALRDSSASSA